MGLVCNMRVSIQGNIRERVGVTDEEAMPGKVSVHYGKRGSSARHPVGELSVARRIRRQMFYDEPRSRHVRLMAVLLEEHPLQNLGALQAIIGNERAAFGE